MRRLSEFFSGAICPIRAFSLLFKPNIMPYVACPLVLSILILSFGSHALSSLIDTGLEMLLANWPNWIRTFISWIITAVVSIWVSFFLVALINIVCCPLNCLLSSSVLRRLRHTADSKTKAFSLLSEIINSLGAFNAELKKVIHYLKYAFIILLCSFLPLINVVTPVLWIAFGGWMLLIEYLDYPFADDDVVFPACLEQITDRKALCIGFGTSITIIALIPVLNWFTTTIGVIGATILYAENFNATSNS